MLGGGGGCTAVNSMFVLKCDSYRRGRDHGIVFHCFDFSRARRGWGTVASSTGEKGLGYLGHIEQKRPNALRCISDIIDGVDM